MTPETPESPETATPFRPPYRPTPPPPPPPVRGFFQRMGTVLKMGLLFVLVLLLLIPLGMVRSVLYERMQRRDEAVRNITTTWGLPQVVAGPVLIVPYKYTVKSWKEELVNGRRERVEAVETLTANAYFLPEQLTVDGQVNPRKLYRGIYEAVVYTSALKVSGRFATPDFSAWKIAPDQVLWEDARVTLAVTDLRGAQGAMHLSFGDQKIPLVPGSLLTGFSSGLQARVPQAKAPAEGWAFSIDLALNGSESIQFAPFGMATEVKMVSNWPDPSFQGAFLPAERNIRADGFEASWKVSYYGRSYPQQWTDRAAMPDGDSLRASLFGATFVEVVDAYRFVERTVKYGILFIALVFTAFFLFEVLSALAIHTFQYTLVGAALCLFYLALLSLSEFISFGAAYLAGAVASSLLITLYCAKVLRGGRRALAIGGLLALIYGFLFVILRLQDYSLLFGTAGLFIALAVVMYVTRNIDWYAKDRG